MKCVNREFRFVTREFSYVTDLCSVSRPPVKHLIIRFSVDINGAHTESACKCEDYAACGTVGDDIVREKDMQP